MDRKLKQPGGLFDYIVKDQSWEDQKETSTSIYSKPTLLCLTQVLEKGEGLRLDRQDRVSERCARWPEGQIWVATAICIQQVEARCLES